MFSCQANRPAEIFTDYLHKVTPNKKWKVISLLYFFHIFFDLSNIHTDNFEQKYPLTAVTFADEKGKQKKVTRVNYLTNLSVTGELVELKKGMHNISYNKLTLLTGSHIRNIPDIADTWNHNYHHVDNLSKTINGVAPRYPNF